MNKRIYCPKNNLQNHYMRNTTVNNYWKTNLKYLGVLLSIWFLVSFGFGILFVDFMNHFQIGGFKLGFLVCATRVNLCFRPFDFYLCFFNESLRR